MRKENPQPWRDFQAMATPSTESMVVLLAVIFANVKRTNIPLKLSKNRFAFIQTSLPS